MLSIAVSFNKVLFEGMVKWDPILWESNNKNHEEKALIDFVFKFSGVLCMHFLVHVRA